MYSTTHRLPPKFWIRWHGSDWGHTHGETSNGHLLKVDWTEEGEWLVEHTSPAGVVSTRYFDDHERAFAWAANKSGVSV